MVTEELETECDHDPSSDVIYGVDGVEYAIVMTLSPFVCCTDGTLDECTFPCSATSSLSTIHRELRQNKEGCISEFNHHQTKNMK